MAHMKMDDCFQVALSDEQVFVVQHQRSVNGGRTGVSGPGFTVFLLKNVNTKM